MTAVSTGATEGTDVSALGKTFQRMAEQAQALADGGESNALRCIAAGEAMAFDLAATMIRETVDPTVHSAVRVRRDALTQLYKMHVGMLEGLLGEREVCGDED